MFNRIVKILVSVIPIKDARTTPILGRWCILNKEYNNRKIDMANIDHCGTCSYDYKKAVAKGEVKPSKASNIARV